VETCEDLEPRPEWGECAADLPVQEECNGLDDDCDGLTDVQDPSIDVSFLPSDPPYPNCRKGSALGECIGVWTCQVQPQGEFGWECGAADPEVEVCNLRDDNCDGVVDDPFIDDAGRYVHLNHCGSCYRDCSLLVQNLRTDPCPPVYRYCANRAIILTRKTPR
jgi:hypothetical protein